MSGYGHPRSWFAMFWAAQGWITIVLAVATLVFSAVSMNQYMRSWTVAQDGVLTWATVADRRIVETDAGEQYFVTYVFRISGEEERIEMRVQPSDYEDAAGFMQYVRYPTDDPQLIADGEAELRSGGEQFRNWALIAGLGGLFMGFWSGRNATHALMARRWGTHEDAYIFERNVSISGNYPSRVHIKFRSHSGAEGRSFSRFTFTFPEVYRGDVIQVYVRNGTAWWIDDTGFRPSEPALQL